MYCIWHYPIVLYCIWHYPIVIYTQRNHLKSIECLLCDNIFQIGEIMFLFSSYLIQLPVNYWLIVKESLKFCISTDHEKFPRYLSRKKQLTKLSITQMQFVIYCDWFRNNISIPLKLPSSSFARSAIFSVSSGLIIYRSEWRRNL